MAAPSPFHRWKRFFPAFDAIHGAIEAADPASLAKDELGCARYLQSAKAEVVEFLCDFPWNHEDYCQILDDLMFEYLVTLKTVPVTRTALASTDLAKAVGLLQEHESEKIRGLARELIHQWRKSDEPAKLEEPTKTSAPLPKKSSPVVGTGRDSMAMMVKMEATKRKLREGYQEAADAKRQLKIVVIQAPRCLRSSRGRCILSAKRRPRPSRSRSGSERSTRSSGNGAKRDVLPRRPSCALCCRRSVEFRALRQ
ncbi:hypothetical protein EJB05_42082 [Eragrostis curvula]|uniref:TFIIS N-terminal domain-containing protein n=1 Tax=Eragrostis curvula TaxID=38414 RepID=A0A5J9TDH5_9POAL|nr:hypothetical protein EJB05_42082 [Eragrostis curvula]